MEHTGLFRMGYRILYSVYSLILFWTLYVLSPLVEVSESNFTYIPSTPIYTIVVIIFCVPRQKIKWIENPVRIVMAKIMRTY